MDLVPRTIVIETEHGTYEVPAWTDGRITTNDARLFKLIERKRAQAYGLTKHRAAQRRARKRWHTKTEE